MDFPETIGQEQMVNGRAEKLVHAVTDAGHLSTDGESPLRFALREGQPVADSTSSNVGGHRPA